MRPGKLLASFLVSGISLSGKEGKSMPVELSSEKGKKCIADGIWRSLQSDGPGGSDAEPLRAAFRRIRTAHPFRLEVETQNFPDDFDTIAPMTLQMFVQGDC